MNDEQIIGLMAAIMYSGDKEYRPPVYHFGFADPDTADINGYIRGAHQLLNMAYNNVYIGKMRNATEEHKCQQNS